MKWVWGQKLIDRLRGKRRTPATRHRLYGKIYYPYYNLYDPICGDEPEVYGRDGQRLRTFFLRDIHSAHSPYSDSRYFMWDRFNFCLDTHFYSHRAMLETMGKPTRRYGMLAESPAINPEDYELFDRHPGLEKDFDAVFTYSARLLSRLPNAKFVPFCANVWIPQERLSPTLHAQKTRNCSIISSAKQMSEQHRFRIALALHCKREGLADTFGTFDGGPRVPEILTVLLNYRYSIAIENIVEDYYFTEKIVNCFAAQTVPIYCGATKIAEFFNADGIIQFSPGDNIGAVLRQCSAEDYQRRLPAILDNFERAKQYARPADYLYEHYLRGA